ncbi:hypothetical protein, partial [Kocuria sp.]|uniref:hypothetical protein n=1 Tax=Kocuria sp. TaxID=1871328 RepID=UPI0026470A4C
MSPSPSNAIRSVPFSYEMGVPRTVMAQATRRISARAETISGHEERSSSSSPLVTSLGALCSSGTCGGCGAASRDAVRSETLSVEVPPDADVLAGAGADAGMPDEGAAGASARE